MRYVLFALVLMYAGQALASDNVIRIIKEDGTVVEFEIGRPPEIAPEPAPEPEPAPTPPALQPGPEPDAVAPAEAEARVNVEETAPPEEQTENIELPREDAVQETSTPQAWEKSPRNIVPIPPRKPAAAKYAAPDAYAPRRSDITPGNSVITKDVALAIALENDAPAARSVQVLPRTYQGREIFVVQFRTEEGLYDMLIDRTTGKVIERNLR